VSLWIAPNAPAVDHACYRQEFNVTRWASEAGQESPVGLDLHRLETAAQKPEAALLLGIQKAVVRRGRHAVAVRFPIGARMAQEAAA
jgi:hypothetical protein